jgi:CheY-like chemotaxis protein
MSTSYANHRTSYVRILCRMSPSCLVGLTIVVVEDHDDARRYLDLFLRQLGAKVMVAGNAFDGLELIKHSRPDLVLSDIKMPGMDGFELLDAIRALGPDAGGNVPVIAMSAFFSRTDETRTRRADFRACLAKPFTPDELVETILGVL